VASLITVHVVGNTVQIHVRVLVADRRSILEKNTGAAEQPFVFAASHRLPRTFIDPCGKGGSQC
jgi:hypothetical protein